MIQCGNRRAFCDARLSACPSEGTPKRTFETFSNGHIDKEVDAGVKDLGKGAPAHTVLLVILMKKQPADSGHDVCETEDHGHERHLTPKVNLGDADIISAVVTNAKLDEYVDGEAQHDHGQETAINRV